MSKRRLQDVATRLQQQANAREDAAIVAEMYAPIETVLGVSKVRELTLHGVVFRSTEGLSTYELSRLALALKHAWKELGCPRGRVVVELDGSKLR